MVWREEGEKGAESRADKATQPGAEGKGGGAAIIKKKKKAGLFF